MLTQTHMQQFNELTSSKLRSSELIKEPALIFVCNLTLHTGVLPESWIFRRRHPTFFWCSRSSRWVLHLRTSRKCRGKPAASLLDAAELLLFEGSRPVWVVMARQETWGWHNHLLPHQTSAVVFEAGDAKPYHSLHFQPQAQYTLYLSSETTEAA